MTNILLKTGLAALMTVSVAGVAQAQSLATTLGQPWIDFSDDFQEGNWSNIAVNSATIDGSVDIDADDISSIKGDVAIAITFPSGAGAGMLEIIGGKIDAGDISTTAAGALNTGDISSAVSSVEISASVDATSGGEFALGGSQAIAVAFTDTFSSSSSATGGYGSSAAAATFSELVGAGSAYQAFDASGSGYETFNGMGSFAASGPLAEVQALNLAYNNAFINGGVDLSASSVATSSITTTVVGAINTGTISLGGL